MCSICDYAQATDERRHEIRNKIAVLIEEFAASSDTKFIAGWLHRILGTMHMTVTDCMMLSEILDAFSAVQLERIRELHEYEHQEREASIGHMVNRLDLHIGEDDE